MPKRIRKNPPKHKWKKIKKKDGSTAYRSNYSTEELNKHNISSPTEKRKRGFSVW